MNLISRLEYYLKTKTLIHVHSEMEGEKGSVLQISGYVTSIDNHRCKITSPGESLSIPYYIVNDKLSKEEHINLPRFIREADGCTFCYYNTYKEFPKIKSPPKTLLDIMVFVRE